MMLLLAGKNCSSLFRMQYKFYLLKEAFFFLYKIRFSCDTNI